MALLPVFQGWKRYAKDYAPMIAGFGDWNCGGPAMRQRYEDAPQQVHEHVKLWMQPIGPQAFKASSFVYWEPVNSEAFRTAWTSVINGGADWVQMVTWDDFGESSAIAPATGIQMAWYDLAAYYINWFKTGNQPAITRDVLYYFHRIQSTTAKPTSPLQTKNFRNMVGEKASDQIELLAFLTKPGKLQIQVGQTTQGMDAQAGMTSFKIPLQEGLPVFRLLRDGKPIIELSSAFPISDQQAFTDLLYRSASSSRKPVFPQ